MYASTANSIVTLREYDEEFLLRPRVIATQYDTVMGCCGMANKPDRRGASTDVRLGLRQQMLELRKPGRTHVEIAQITCYTRLYVSLNFKRLDWTLKMLVDMSRGGGARASLRARSAKAERRVQRLVDGKCQNQLLLRSSLWSCGANHELIRWKFYIRLSFEHPEVEAREKRENAEISFGAAKGIRPDGSPHRGCATPGQTPMVKIPPRPKSFSIIATVMNEATVRFMIYPGRPNPEWLIVFRRKLIKAFPRNVFLNLANLKVDKAKLAREWLKELVNWIEAFRLPPYSPELIPSEYCNGDLKREIQCGVPPPDVDDLKQTMLVASRHAQKSLRRVRANRMHRNSIYVAKLHRNCTVSIAGTRVPERRR